MAAQMHRSLGHAFVIEGLKHHGGALISEGGSSESEVTAVAVMPCRRVWSAAVITDTAAGKRRIASLKEARNSSAVMPIVVPS